MRTRARQDPLPQTVPRHFYAKTCAVVVQSRATHLAALDDPPLSPALTGPGPGSTASVAAGATTAGSTRRTSAAGREKARRTNKWFNLELPDTEQFRAELKTWRNLSRFVPSPSASSSFSRASSTSSASGHAAPTVPPMVLDVLLDTSDLTPNQVLVLADQRGKRLRVPAPRATPASPSAAGHASPLPRSGGRSPLPGRASSAPNVVLERWSLTLLPSAASAASGSGSSQAELPTVYKHAILHFRALFTLARALPAYALHRKLARRRAGGLRLAVRLAQGAPPGADAEVGVEDALEGGEREIERVVFPGVETPLGTLVLTLAYRLNTDFSVEEIETLLSSRFIDEDFFRPTVARYRTEPGSLPLTSTSPARASPPVALVRGMTGLAPLPSYGSLSSRHQYAPAPSSVPAAPSPLSGSPRPPSAVPLPAPAAIPGAADSPAPSPPRPGSGASSSSRFPAYAPASVSAAAAPSTSSTGGGVEPAFISLSRARGASFVGAGASGGGGAIQRASPLSASPGAGTGLRRTSLTSSSGGAGGSPIFRPGSYLGAVGAASSSSPSGAPAGRQQVFPLAPAGATGSVPLSGSPLAGGMSPRPGMPPSYGSQGSYTRSGILRASSSSGTSADDPAGVGLARRPSGGAAARALSFGVAGSLGRSSPGAGASGVSSGGGVSRLGTLLDQYDAATPAARGDRRRFVHEGRAPDDANDIHAFLGMLDSKPDLRAPEATGGALGRSTAVVSKRDVDEQLRLLRSSVLGLAGSSGESPSPPALFSPGPPPLGASPTPRGASGLSNLRRQTSRLSIEEEPAAEAAARSPSAERAPIPPTTTGTTTDRTPRMPFRTLHGKRDALVASPTLSAASASTAIPALPSAGGVEPRFLPLPLSSTTSPLASPGGGAQYGLHHAHAHAQAYGAYPFAVLAPQQQQQQPYPPLPYPPAAPSPASEPVTIAAPRAVPSSSSTTAGAAYLSRGVRLAAGSGSGSGLGSGSTPAPQPGSEHTSAAASIASFDVDAGAGSGSYRGEEEAVGRLELDEGPAVDDDVRRGRGRGWGAEVDEEEVAAHAGCVPPRHSRDATPAAARLGGGGGGARGGAAPPGYLAPRRSSASRARTSPPEISWMG